MDDSEALNRLAEIAGIEPSYWDNFGRFYETSPAAKRGLLKAMGFAVDSPAVVRHSLREYEERQWRRRVDPVYVLRRTGGSLAVEISLSATMRSSSLRWIVTLEDGGERTGDSRVSDLDLIGGYRFGAETIERRRLGLPPGIPEGYHRLTVLSGAERSFGALIVTPERAYRPEWLARGDRVWGIACHLYSLRSQRNWGIGDLSDLRTLIRGLAPLENAAIGLNPLHALFPADPERASPYSASSRLFLDPLYIDVTGVPGFAEDEDLRRELSESGFARRQEAARAERLVDYRAVSQLKLAVLERLHRWFERHHPGGENAGPLRRTFEDFKLGGGEALRRFVQFEALQEHFAGRQWRDWPEPYRRPGSAEIATFAREHASRVDFHAFLQWQADRQLAAAALAAAEARMAIGLYRDLAIGAQPDGAEIWAVQDVFADRANVGAPPDAFNPLGQDWGTLPPNPWRLREAAYAPVVALLRANMRYAGALRIDHVLGLQHLFCIVPGQPIASGAYVRYRFDELLGIVALESRRNRCLIVGEDLGTVPEGFRERMQAEGILSYRIGYFERHPDGLYRRPSTYPPLALAAANTHDLPTLTGYWSGADLEIKKGAGLFPKPEDFPAAVKERTADRGLFLAALKDQGLLPDDFPLDPSLSPERMEMLIEAIYRFLGRSRAHVTMVSLDDASGEIDQLNIPGTVAEYPNWRRKLSLSIEELINHPFLHRLAKAMREERARMMV